MFFVYIGLYTFILSIAWGLFIVLKMHSYKFRNFSSDIEKITTLLMIFLGILSITGYILIFFLNTNISTSNSIDTSGNYDTVNY